MSQIAIEARSLVHLYEVDQSEHIRALAGVDLDIEEGEFVVIIGPNGSGKSTLAKHLNALLVPSEGTVLVFGMDTKDPELTWEIRRSAGMVFQNPDNQIVATVVEEDVAFGPENLGVRPEEIRKRVEEALAAVGMLEFRRHAPHLLSGGQKQRVAIAGVLALRSRCIILDEPTAMLDPRGRSEVLTAVRELNKKMGITVVHITHFMDEAVFADKVIVMDRGQVVMQGPPAEVFQHPEKLRAMGLEVPAICQLSHLLRTSGFDIRGDVLTVDELVEELCRLKSKS